MCIVSITIPEKIEEIERSNIKKMEIISKLMDYAED